MHVLLTQKFTGLVGNGIRQWYPLGNDDRIWRPGSSRSFYAFKHNLFLNDRVILSNLLVLFIDCG